MVNYARVISRSSPLHTDFAREFVRRRFGPVVTDALYKNLLVFTRGKNKGKVKGNIVWRKCEVGGWRIHDGRGSVCRPGVFDVHVVVENRTWLDENANATDQMRIDAMLEISKCSNRRF